ncbi:hypothetical protein CY34DRAFT_17002 [Suillus luteus UH-Slu-Lm8-n1]|uniref:Uncharacterized protein n=1 Tax=Suillus luteus UH-Slu-Lm8-n1 TaxID=930992 RepID=A0A0D0ABP3_9AGAM|nr:hypothetical protein CY34DRAFT_17002 [Suillus luteus UH-Slu-Lm8-n1]
MSTAAPPIPPSIAKPSEYTLKSSSATVSSRVVSDRFQGFHCCWVDLEFIEELVQWGGVAF